MIRAACTSDAAALAGLMCELGYQTSESEMQSRLEKILPDPLHIGGGGGGQGVRDDRHVRVLQF